jgi:glutathione S-transferase
MVQVNVYGDAKATCTQRVLILLEELSLKYDIQSIDLSKGEQRGEEFMKLQPFGKVPAVEYDDRVLFESRSILRYIAKNNNDINDLLGDADTDIWLEVESQNYNPHVSKIVNERLFKKWRGEKPDQEVVENELKMLETVLDVYEKRLSEVSFIGGDQFSIADISHIPYTNYMLRCGYKELYKSRPNVYRWVKQIIKRSSVESVIGNLK